MHLHRDFTGSNFSRDLPVHQAGSYQGHHLSLARAEPTESDTQIVCPLVVFTPLPIAVERKYITRKLFVEVITDGQGYSATRAEYQVTRWLSILSSVSTIGRTSANVRVSKDY